MIPETDCVGAGGEKIGDAVGEGVEKRDVERGGEGEIIGGVMVMVVIIPDKSHCIRIISEIHPQIGVAKMDMKRG